MRYALLETSDQESPALDEEVVKKVPAPKRRLLPYNATCLIRDVCVAVCTLILVGVLQWVWGLLLKQNAPVLGMCI